MTLTLLIKFANMFEKWFFFFLKSCCFIFLSKIFPWLSKVAFMRNIDKFERYLRGKKWTPLSEYYSSNAFNKLNSQRKIIFFIVPIVVIWNSQYWNIKKCLKCWPYFSCTSKCECIFFFPRSNKVLQGTSLHHCQSGDVRARAKLFVRLGTSLLFLDKSNGNTLLHHGIFFFFHENYPIYIQKDSL